MSEPETWSRLAGRLAPCTPSGEGAIPIDLVLRSEFGAWLDAQPTGVRTWLRASGWWDPDAPEPPAPGSFALVPDAGLGLASVLVVVRDESDEAGTGGPGTAAARTGSEDGDPRLRRLDPWCLAGAAGALPDGRYRVRTPLPGDALGRAALGWALAGYRFDRYRSAEGQGRTRTPVLELDPPPVRERALREVEAITLVRDLVNTPAADLMPAELFEAARALGGRYGASVTQLVGEDLLAEGYPAIHAVGRSSEHAPRLVDLTWGEPDHPRVSLVGKGVCFDSGGLDLKPANAMRLMKKDMGGAAHALGLASLVMAAALPVRLRVLVPAVENAVSERAYRPGDIVRTRAGLAVEIDNTDAEGRVVLADALAEASREKPAVLLDFATLTGAARVALGTELPALFTPDDELARGLERASAREQDPLWRLPLHAPYRELIESRVGDLANSGSSPWAGAITAALFLHRFVGDTRSWAHFDLMAWNVSGRPGRPEGGEAMGLRALGAWLEERFGQAHGPE